MTSPRIQDAEGRELSVGDRVREARPYADSLEVIDIVGQEIGTRHLRNGTYERFWAVNEKRNTYRCSDLLLIDQDDKGGGEDG